MAGSVWYQGSLVVASPSGTLLACLLNEQLKICFTKSPDRHVDFRTCILQKDALGLRWASDSSRVMIISPSTIEIIDLEDEQSRIRLNNGSSSLGQYTSAEFIQPDQILTIWTFGHAKIWNLNTGQSVDLDIMKVLADSTRWAARPTTKAPVIAYLSRPSAEDYLVLHFAESASSLSPVRLPTIDARALHWSPDGNWLVVVDSSRQSQNVHILTADGHLYKSYPVGDMSEMESADLGIKNVIWSPDSHTLALTRYDGCIDIISGRTLSQTVVIEHSITITQGEETAIHLKIWQECVSASAERSYKELAMPVSPPLSRAKKSHEPNELGVAEVAFSCDGKYIASRDESMLSTVWVWNVQHLIPHAVILQHNNIRKLRWHPAIPHLLMLDCGENIVYLFEVDSGNAPQHVSIATANNTTPSFVVSKTNPEEVVILAASRGAFTVLTIGPQAYLNDDASYLAMRGAVDQEDSLFEILSGKADLSNDNDETEQLDDTFDGRQTKQKSAYDPLDDSEIF